MANEVKRKRGRPPAKQKQVGIKKEKKFKKEKVPRAKKEKPVLKRHFLLDVADYIKSNYNDVNQAYTSKEMRRIGCSREYYLIKSFLGFFGMQDASFNLEAIKEQKPE